MPARKDTPATVRRSNEKARRTWARAHNSAVESYGEGERAHRTAFAALKHTHEKVGDHWEPKEQAGPSDEGAARGAADRDAPTAGGVDARAGKRHLYRLAADLGISGRSKMTKNELVEAIRRENRRRTAQARDNPTA